MEVFSMNVYLATPSEGPYSGKPCEDADCTGVLHVYRTQVVGKSRVRTFRCNRCGKAPSKSIQCVPLEHAPPLAARRKTDLPSDCY
jgi:hypothetical protein